MTTALLAACGGGRSLTAGAASLEPSPQGAFPSPGQGPAAADLVRAARSAFAAAPSVHVTGTLVKGAQSYELDVRLKGAAGGTARIVPSTAAPAAKPHPEVRVIRIGDVAWVGGNLGFWRSVSGDEARARRLVDSWLKVPADGGNFGEYVVFTQPAALLALLPDPKQPAALEPRVPFQGRPAIPVVVDRTTRLTVAAEGPAYPLQVSGLTSDETVSRFLNFSDYGAPVTLLAPGGGGAEPGSGGAEPGSGGAEPGSGAGS
jgi:hypothetical protein